MTLRTCTTCQRHYQDQEPSCPFCATASAPGSPRLSKRLALGGLMLLTAATATACYGTPPVPAPGAPSESDSGAVIDYKPSNGSDAKASPAPADGSDSAAKPKP